MSIPRDSLHQQLVDLGWKKSHELGPNAFYYRGKKTLKIPRTTEIANNVAQDILSKAK